MTASDIINALSKRYSTTKTEIRSVLSSVQKDQRIKTVVKRKMLYEILGEYTQTPQRLSPTTKGNRSGVIVDGIIKFVLSHPKIQPTRPTVKPEPVSNSNSNEEIVPEIEYPVAKIQNVQCPSTKKGTPLKRDVYGECCFCLEEVFIDKTKQTCRIYRDCHEKQKNAKQVNVLECPRCKMLYCHVCLIEYSTSTKNLPVCKTPNCGIPLDEFAMSGFFPDARIQDFRSVVKLCLLDDELGRLHQTTKRIMEEGYTTLGNSRIDTTGRLNTSSNHNARNKSEKRVIVACHQDGCAGFLNGNWLCERCGKRRCHRCREPIEINAVISRSDEPNNSEDKRHFCDKDTVATIELIKAEGCICPSCGNSTERTQGCAHMFCLICKTSFNYVKGGVGIKIPDSHNSNPAYHAYRRKLREEALANSTSTTVVEVENSQVGQCQEECPAEGTVPSREGLIQFLTKCGVREIDILTVLKYLRAISQGSELHGYLNAMVRVENRDCDFLRELVYLAKNKVKIENYNKQQRYGTDSYKTFSSMIGMPTKNGEHAVPSGVIETIINMATGGDYFYDERACIKKLQTIAFRNYREKQRVFHHRGILNTFRAGIADIINNIYSFNDVVSSIHQAMSTIGCDEKTVKENIELIKKQVIEQIKTFERLVTFANTTFEDVDILLGYNTSPYFDYKEVCLICSSRTFKSRFIKHSYETEYIRDQITKNVLNFGKLSDLIINTGANGNASSGVYTNKKISSLGNMGVVISHFKNIKHLDLRNNLLTTAVVSKFSSCDFAVLASLDLSYNKIDNITKEMFQGMPMLNKLDMGHCGLKSVPRDCFIKQKPFSLSMEHNELTDCDFLEYVLSPLETNSTTSGRVSLAKNSIKSINMGCIGSAYDVNFTSNKITEIKGTPKRPYRIYTFSLAFNLLREINHELTEKLIGCERLVLTENPIQIIRKDSFIHQLTQPLGGLYSNQRTVYFDIIKSMFPFLLDTDECDVNYVLHVFMKRDMMGNSMRAFTSYNTMYRNISHIDMSIFGVKNCVMSIEYR